MDQRRMDYHLHTNHSMDGRQTMDELCRTMVERGVNEICLTEHIEPGHPEPWADQPPVWENWLRDIEKARIDYPTLTIRAGVEIGDNPGFEQKIEEMLSPLPLDFRMLSLHLVNGRDCYFDGYFEGRTRDECYREYAEAKAASVLRWDNFDCVSHIGYVAKFAPFTGPERPLRYEDAPDAFDTLLRSVIERGKCIEINTSGYGTTGDALPHNTIVRRYIDLGGEIFTFGSDSHATDRDYDNIERAKDAVRAMGGKYQASFCQRKMTLYRI